MHHAILLFENNIGPLLFEIEFQLLRWIYLKFIHCWVRQLWTSGVEFGLTIWPDHISKFYQPYRETYPCCSKKFTKNCHVKKFEAKFYGWMPFQTPTLFHSNSEKLSVFLETPSYKEETRLGFLYLKYTNTFQKIIFGQHPTKYNAPYPVPGVTFCLIQVHHGKLIIEELIRIVTLSNLWLE